MGNGRYIPTVSFQGGLVFEKDFKEGFVINPEVFYSLQSFTYKNSETYFVDNPEAPKDASFTHDIKQARIQANMLMQYKLGKSKFSPYVAAGPVVGYLMSSVFEGLTNLESRDNITGSTIDNTDKYKAINLSAMVAVGGRIKLSGIYITADIRYQYGFFNIVKPENRHKLDTPDMERLYTQYSYIDNDFSLNQAMFTIGLMYPFFSPKKLIK
jgi:hypothetical protein